MYVFNLFGGIGSRSRNGFGGFTVLNWEEVLDSFPYSFVLNDAYSRDNILRLVTNIDNHPYTSFTQRTKLFSTKKTFNNWDSALADIGKIYRSARESLERKHFYEKRQYIGAPIIVDKKDESFLERHSKPYFLKVAREGAQFRSYILFLPSLYVHGRDKDQFGKTINHAEVDQKFISICNEMNSYLSKNMDTIL